MFPLAFSEYLVVKAWKRTLVIMQQGGVSTCDKGGSLAVEGKMEIIDAVYLCVLMRYFISHVSFPSIFPH
jgi:hypothetical protein